MSVDPGQGSPPQHLVYYNIKDEDAEAFLRKLADPEETLYGDLQARPLEVLRENGILFAGEDPEDIALAPQQDIADFVDRYLSGETRTNNVGYAILYMMLGAMPLVVADRDGAA